VEPEQEKKISSRKMTAFWLSTIVGITAFAFLALRMDPKDLITLCQFYFGYQGIITTALIGGNFGEYWAKTKGGVGT